MTQNSMIKRYEHIVGMMGELSYYLPDVLKGFDDMRLSTMLSSTLDSKTKDLIGLGLAIAGGGEGWIEHFVIRALQDGADRQEILETIGVAILMAGGNAMKASCDAYEALQEYEARDRKYKTEVMNDALEQVVETAVQRAEQTLDRAPALAKTR